MEELFNNILDKDEQVVKVFKPNKLKMFFSMFFRWMWIWVWFLFLLLLEIFGEHLDENGNVINETPWGAIIAFSVIIAVLIIINIVCFVLEYKKTYYAYTNKRVVIRRGIIGVDYKSLDMSMIGAVTVNVTLLDKIIHKNTGTIVFGSMASPINQNNFMFRFANIVNPYDVYKEIKNCIDEFKNANTKTNIIEKDVEPVKNASAPKKRKCCTKKSWRKNKTYKACFNTKETNNQKKCNIISWKETNNPKKCVSTQKSWWTKRIIKKQKEALTASFFMLKLNYIYFKK